MGAVSRSGRWLGAAVVAVLASLGSFEVTSAQEFPPVAVEGQPLAANVQRVLQTLNFLGVPLPAATTKELQAAIKDRDAKKLQQILDHHVLTIVSLSPEARVKAARGQAKAVLQQAGYTPFVVKIINESTVATQLNLKSPQAGPVYFRDPSGKNVKGKDSKDHFLDVELFRKPPMTANLSGLKVEYAIALVSSSEAGKREATLRFDVGQGTQDLGFRGEVPVLFDVRPAITVKLGVRDFDGTPTIGRFTFKDKLGRVYPPARNDWPRTFSFKIRYTAAMATWCCCRRVN